MKIAVHTWFALVVGAAHSLAACGGGQGGLPDKNTNWLRSCSDSKSCSEGLRCVCGVCTSACDRSAACSAYEAGAVCVALTASDSACSASEIAADPRVCSLSCKDDKACTAQDKALTCVQGTCARAPRLGSDAGVDRRDGSVAKDAAPTIAVDGSIARSGVPDSSIGVGPDVPDAATPDTGPCGAGFACDVMQQLSRPIAGLVANDDGFIYWSEWGSLDELGNHRQDGAIRRVAKDSDGSENVLTDLEKPWRLWADADRVYWLSGEPIDFDADQGLQKLFEAPRMANSTAVELKTDAFAHVQMHKGEFAWQAHAALDDNGRPVGDSFSVQRWNPHQGAQAAIEVSSKVSYVLDGIDADALYLEDGRLSVMRVGLDNGAAQELLSDPPAFMATVGDDALWLIHQDSAGRNWVSSLPKGGGRITHVGDAGDYAERPQPGDKVVWFVTWVSGPSWQLWSMSKIGGEREPAFRWPADTGRVPNESRALVWIADGDTAWVFGNNTLVRVERAQ